MVAVHFSVNQNEKDLYKQGKDEDLDVPVMYLVKRDLLVIFIASRIVYPA